MSDAENFLEDARKAFGLASNSTQVRAIEHYAEMGRDYLRRAHEASQLVVSPLKPASSGWRFS